LALEALLSANPQLLILSDEVYEHLQYEGEHCSVLTSPILRNRSFVTYSFGKTFNVTGWKVGYLIAPDFLTNEFRKVHQFIVFSGNNTMQYGIAKYMDSHKEWKALMPFMKKKRDLIIKRLMHSRFKIIPCTGTYFCLLDYSEISDLNDVAFAKWLTTEIGVAVIPISVFYARKKDDKIVRLCFAKKDETLIKATELLCKI
jgi:methionine aminotransferase